MSRYIDEHRARFGVEPICQTLGVSASAYYERASGERSARAMEDERLLEVIRETHKKNYEAYGYRRLWKALQRAGEQIPRCQVQRLMRANGIRGAKRRGKPWRTTTPDPLAQRRPDLVNRDFTARHPDALWLADFSYLRCWEGLVFFSFVIDAFSRRVVGWQFAPHMRTTLVLDALRMALGTREPGADVALVQRPPGRRARRRRMSGSRGGCPPRLPQNRTCAVRIRLLGTAGCEPRRRPVSATSNHPRSGAIGGGVATMCWWGARCSSTRLASPRCAK